MDDRRGAPVWVVALRFRVPAPAMHAAHALDNNLSVFSPTSHASFFACGFEVTRRDFGPLRNRVAARLQALSQLPEKPSSPEVTRRTGPRTTPNGAVQTGFRSASARRSSPNRPRERRWFACRQSAERSGRSEFFTTVFPGVFVRALASRVVRALASRACSCRRTCGRVHAHAYVQASVQAYVRAYVGCLNIYQQQSNRHSRALPGVRTCVRAYVRKKLHI